MGSNIKSMPDQKTIDFMYSIYKSAEPYEDDDPRLNLVDSKDETHNSRMSANFAKHWLIDVGVLSE